LVNEQILPEGFMKTVLILRHAKSDWGTPGLPDFERSLAKRGLEDAPRMGEVLAQFDSVPDRILSSPARRAKQTAELVAKACGFRKAIRWEDSFYEGDSEDLIAALQRLPETVERVLLIGHNPILEETVALLAASFSPVAAAAEGWAIKIPTAGLVCLNLEIMEWKDLQPGDGVLLWFIIPKLVKALA
jgi:phosphohistidine phosphatase